MLRALRAVFCFRLCSSAVKWWLRVMWHARVRPGLVGQEERQGDRRASEDLEESAFG